MSINQYKLIMHVIESSVRKKKLKTLIICTVQYNGLVAINLCFLFDHIDQNLITTKKRNAARVQLFVL